MEKSMSNFVGCTAPADGLAPSGARASAGTVMTRFGSLIHMGPTLEGITHLGLKKMADILQETFQLYFLEWKLFIFYSNFIEMCS